MSDDELEGQILRRQAGVVLNDPSAVLFQRFGHSSIDQLCVDLIETCRTAPHYDLEERTVKDLGVYGRYELIKIKPMVWNLIDEDLHKIGTGVLILIPDPNALEA